ncbi:cytidine deaminase [Microbacterium sp. HMH0099]|uniref:cytidine deaminase n=1 Tax=Microbacterium sp. HMH0099 TaxID=3414026 RepID=UPI003BF6672B
MTQENATTSSPARLSAQTLIDLATPYLNPERRDSRGSGDVAALLVTAEGTHFFGLSIDVPCSMGFCAEAGAIGAMITARQSEIAQAVAVAFGADGEVVVYPPCGRCREFLYQIDHRNRRTEIVLGADRTVLLEELLPELWN